MWPGYENGYRVPGKYSVHGSASALVRALALAN